MGPLNLELIRKTREWVDLRPRVLIDAICTETQRSPEAVELELSQTLRWLSRAERRFPALPAGEAYGAAVVIGSSVWPVFHSIQFLLALLLTGNRPVLKPSERVQRLSAVLLEQLAAVDSLWGKVALSSGDRESGRQWASSRDVDLVIFQGTYETGMRVLQDNLPDPGKEVLLYLGAKNPAVVLEDLEEKQWETLLEDAFLEGGQHCMSTPVIFVPRGILDRFTDRFLSRAEGLRFSLPDDGLRDRYLKFSTVAEREGGEVHLRGRPSGTGGDRIRVSPTVSVFREMEPKAFRRSTLFQTEIFGPHVTLAGYGTEDSETGLRDLLGASSQGLACALYAKDRSRALDFARGLPFGRVAIEGGLARFDPWKSGRPWRKSGNHGLLGEGLFSQLVRPRALG